VRRKIMTNQSELTKNKATDRIAEAFLWVICAAFAIFILALSLGISVVVFRFLVGLGCG